MESDGHGDRRKTTATSLRVVDAIDELEGGRLTDISKHIGLSTSTVYTHLETLRDVGYVTKVGDTYQLGLKLFHLGEEARRRDERYNLAKEHAFELANATGEEVSFAVEEMGRSIILFDEVSNPSVEGFQVGHQFYMHSSASGKAILAEFSDEHINEIIDRWGLPEQTSNTITSCESLFEEIKRTRSRGYAVNDQEAFEGLRSVALAVKDPNGDVFGSLDISGPPYRLPSDEKLVELLRPVVSELEHELEADSAEMTQEW